MAPEGGAEGVVVVVTIVGVAAATVVTCGSLPLLLVVLEAAAPAARPTQHIPHTHIPTITKATTMDSTIPAKLTPTIRPTRLTAWKEHDSVTNCFSSLSYTGHSRMSRPGKSGCDQWVCVLS